MRSERRLLENRILSLFSAVPRVTDDELRAELTKHLCVLCSGLIEVACREILSKYSCKRSSPEILRAVESMLSDFQNPKVGKIVDLLAKFSADKAHDWQDSLSEEESDSIDSIVSNRHQIAHGRSIGLSFDIMQNYFSQSINALHGLERAFPER